VGILLALKNCTFQSWYGPEPSMEWRRKVIRRSNEPPRAVGVRLSKKVQGQLVWAELNEDYAKEVCPTCRLRLMITSVTEYKNGRLCLTVRCRRGCFTARWWRWKTVEESAVPKEA